LEPLSLLVILVFFALHVLLHDNGQHQIQQEKRAEKNEAHAENSRHYWRSLLLLQIIQDHRPTIQRYYLKNRQHRLTNIIERTDPELNIGVFIVMVATGVQF